MKWDHERSLIASSKIIETGYFFLLVAAPLAFGTVEKWAYTGMEIISALILLAFISFRISRKRLSPAAPYPLFSPRIIPLYFCIALFILGIVVQIIPFPRDFVRSINPLPSFSWILVGRASPADWVTLSFFPGQTIRELLKVATYAVLSLVLLGYQPPNKPKEVFISRLILTVVITGFIISVLGILQRYSWTGKIYWLRSIRFGSPFGPYVNRNHFAGYIGMVIPLALGVLFSRFYSRGSRPLRNLRIRLVEGNPLIPLLAFMILIMVVALILSFSRGGIIVFGLGLIYFALRAKKYRLISRREIVICILVLLLTVVVIYFSFDLDPIIRKFQGASQVEKPGALRFTLWKDTWRICQDFPWIGTGLGTFRKIYPYYKTFRWRIIYTHAENDYLQLMAEMGIWVIITVLAAIILYFRNVFSWKPGKARRVTGVSGKRWFCLSRRCIVLGSSTAVLVLLLQSLGNFQFYLPANALLFTLCATFSLTMTSDGEEIGDGSNFEDKNYGES